MPECPRCNATLKRITPNHKRACAIPTPGELARTFIDEPCTTTKELAYTFNVHRDFMEGRLKLGGIPHSVQAHRGHLLRRMFWGKIKKEKPRVPPGKKPCPDCEILIPTNQSICRACAVRRQRHKKN